MTVEEFKRRMLKERYIVCYVVESEIKMIEGGIIKDKKCVIIYGITMENKREWVGIYVEKEDSVNFWYEIMQDMKKRGTEAVGFFVINKNNKLEKAIRIVYNDSIMLEMLYTKIKNISRYLIYDKDKRVQTQLNNMVQYKTKEEYEDAIKVFKEKYVSKKILEEIFVVYEEIVKKYYEYEYEIRIMLNQYYYIREMENDLKNICKKIGVEITVEDIIEQEIKYIEITEEVKANRTEIFIAGINIMNEREEIKGIEIKI